MYFCDKCDYETDRLYDWNKHLKCSKHLRDGKHKISKCNQRNYEANNAWNVKMHILYMHLSKEDRMKQKFYCDICDYAFPCNKYLESHKISKNHGIEIKIKNSLISINEIYDKIYNSNNDEIYIN